MNFLFGEAQFGKDALVGHPVDLVDLCRGPATMFEKSLFQRWASCCFAEMDHTVACCIGVPNPEGNLAGFIISGVFRRLTWRRVPLIVGWTGTASSGIHSKKASLSVAWVAECETEGQSSGSRELWAVHRVFCGSRWKSRWLLWEKRDFHLGDVRGLELAGHMPRGSVKIPGRLARTLVMGLVQTLLDRALRQRLQDGSSLGRGWTGHLASLDGMGLTPSHALRSIWSPARVLISLNWSTWRKRRQQLMRT